MASFKNVGKLSKILFVKNTPFIYITRNYEKIVTKSASEILQELRTPEELKNIPGPFPKTKEEIEKAAAKYNMHPAEYKPFPDDHRYTGDYPDLPWISYDAKDPFYPWDYPNSRINYGEPIHKYIDVLTGDRYEYGVYKPISDFKSSMICLLIFGVLYALCYFSPDTSHPVMEKQYPGKGTYYTFELVK